MRQRLIWAAIVLGAFFYVFAFFLGDETSAGRALHLTEVRTGLSLSINVVATMAFGLGIVNLFWVHGANVLARKKEWPFSVVVFVTFFTVTAFLLWEYRLDAQGRTLKAEATGALATYRAAFETDDPVERDRLLDTLSPEELRLVNRCYEYDATYRFEPRTFYLNNFISPLAATVMSLLGFYITYAAYRAFRIRSLEATVMMLSAAVVILGSDPLGGWLSAVMNTVFGGSEVVDLPYWADVDNRVLNSGMQRGLEIGIAVAVVAMGLRVLLGLERGLTEPARGGD